MIKKNDIILIGAVVLLSLAVIIFINVTKEEGSKLLVTIDGNEYNSFDLNKDTVFTIETENGEWNTFEIKDGHAKMTKASCPDKLCIKNFDSIHNNHETITCLPNKVVLEVVGGDENDIDIIAN